MEENNVLIQSSNDEEDNQKQYNSLLSGTINLLNKQESSRINSQQSQLEENKSTQDQLLVKQSNEVLGKRGRKSVYKGAQYPQLIDKAKLILPNHNYDIQKLLELDEFKPLKDSKDLNRFLSKYVLNQYANTKSQLPKIDQEFETQENRMIPKEKELQNIVTSFQENQITTTPQANYGAKIQSEITSNYLREYMLIKPIERYQFIERIFQRNSQSVIEFLINLKTTCSSNFYEGMFSLIHELNQNSKTNLQIKTRLFVQSLLYYKNEIIVIECELLKNSMRLLAQRPNSEQTLGLANYIFFNEVEAFYKLQDELIQLDNKNIGIIPLMAGTFSQFRIDPQVIRLLPNTLLCLNKPFIQILKQDQGLRLIREVPINVVGDFVQISALSSAQNYEALDNFIKAISNIFIEKWDYLDQEDFSFFISHLSKELKGRNIKWVSQLNEIVQLTKDLVFCQVEKGMKNQSEIILQCLSGNKTMIQHFINAPKTVKDFTQKDINKALHYLKQMNTGIISLEKFVKNLKTNNFNENQTLNKIEKNIGFKFLSLQKLCIQYILFDENQYQFLNYGVGNGKTLLCTTLAILLAFQELKNILIIGKNDHLILRDEKVFEKLILQMGFNVNVNQFENKRGIYYVTQKFLEINQNNEMFVQYFKEYSYN